MNSGKNPLSKRYLANYILKNHTIIIPLVKLGFVQYTLFIIQDLIDREAEVTKRFWPITVKEEKSVVLSST